MNKGLNHELSYLAHASPVQKVAVITLEFQQQEACESNYHHSLSVFFTHALVFGPDMDLDLHTDIDKYTSHPKVMGEIRVCLFLKCSQLQQPLQPSPMKMSIVILSDV